MTFARVEQAIPSIARGEPVFALDASVAERVLGGAAPGEATSTQRVHAVPQGRA
jgi:hypothetical protein